MRENQFLELVNLILEGHEIGDCLVALVGIIDGPQTYIFFVLESTIERWMLMVKGKLCQEEMDVFFDQRPVSTHTLAGHAPVQAVDPSSICHSLPQCDWMAFLKDLVYRDQSFEGLYFVREDGLAAEAMSVELLSQALARATHTFIPDQKACEDLWSQVYTMQLRTCLRFGAVSSGLVAFLMLITSSVSDLETKFVLLAAIELRFKGIFNVVATGRLEVGDDAL